MQLDCGATVTTLPSGAVACVDGTGAAVAWTVVPSFNITQLDSTSLAGAFGAGFTICFLAWAAAKGATIIVRFIRSM